MTTKDKSADRIKQQITEIENLVGKRADSAALAKWRRDTEVVIERIFGRGTRHLDDFMEIEYVTPSFEAGADERAYRDGLRMARAILASIAEELDEYGSPEPDAGPAPTDVRLRNLCNRFHRVARQLRERHDSRPTLEIDDEYDVQDLMHALLRLLFDDVRAEEWTPSYAGANSRVDFLLKDERTFVEIKKTRKGLGDREIGSQLLVDVERYRAHPSCGRLFCFVYDPEGRIANPKGLEHDLERAENGFSVSVVIAPAG